mgnify:CR=1 FL=1
MKVLAGVVGGSLAGQMAAIEGYLKGCAKLGVSIKFMTVDLHDARDTDREDHVGAHQLVHDVEVLSSESLDVV